MTSPLFDLAPPVANQPRPEGELPTWLRRRLEDTGLMDAETGATRTARTRRCPTCRRPIIHGLDANWAAQIACCDPWPLTPIGEALTLLAGRRTWSLTFAGRYELDYRDHWRIRGLPAATRHDVLAAHECGLPPPHSSRTHSVLLDAPNLRQHQPTDPPF